MDYSSVPFCNIFPAQDSVAEVCPENEPLKITDSIHEAVNSGDQMKIMTVLSSMCATLAQFDTETYRGKDFSKIVEVLRSWVEPLEKQGFLHLETIISPSGRPLIIIAPNTNEDKKHIAEIERASSNHYSTPVKIGRPAFHAHIDTIAPAGEFGSRKLYLDDDKNLIWGRGTADMLMSICSMVMSLYTIESNSEELNFWFCISSNEELPSLDSSQQLDSLFTLSRIQPTLYIELEPTPAQGGVFSTEIHQYHEYPYDTERRYTPEEIFDLQQRFRNGFVSTNYSEPGFYILNGGKKPIIPKNYRQPDGRLAEAFPGGHQSTVGIKVLEILNKIIADHYPVAIPPSGRTGLSGFISSNRVFKENTRWVTIVGAYATATTMIQWFNYQFYKNAKQVQVVVTFTLPSLGHGRHSPVEGTSLEDAAKLVAIIFDINRSPLCVEP